MRNYRIARKLCAVAALSTTVFEMHAQSTCGQEISLGGFIPLVGIGMTDEFKDPNILGADDFFIADPQFSVVGSPVSGDNQSAYYDLALVDSGAATHILTSTASGPNGFDINGNGFATNNTQDVGGATGLITLQINEPLAIFAGGLAASSTNGTKLTMNTNAMRGQSSFATLSAPVEWELPNILGLPMLAHHALSIRNDLPQIFQHQGRTVRTPQVEFIDRGTGGDQGIVRRTDLVLRPGASFIVGPLYVFGLGTDFTVVPSSPSVMENAALFVKVDMANGDPIFPGTNIREHALNDAELLFDTGADLTVVSELTAKRLGFDVVLDQPDFVLEVEGSGGVSSGVPGFYLDEFHIDTVGGSFTLHHVPVAVLDVTNPNDPGNIIPGIVGMHLFNGRNLVIDANPSIGQGGAGPSLYISDPVTSRHAWAAISASATWTAPTSWSQPGVPTSLWVAEARNAAAIDQRAVVSANSTVFQLLVAGAAGKTMNIEIQSGAALTSFGETRIDAGGRITLAGGKLDAQFVNIDGGTLAGSGQVFVGAGPITGAVRNLSGRVEPGGAGIGTLDVTGDFSNLDGGVLDIDLAGKTAGLFDRLTLDRFAFLNGTLDVALIDGGAGLFSPQVGDQFTILTAAQGVVGEFDQLRLPGGFVWDVDYLPASVVLKATALSAGGALGDFDGDGDVDGADFTMWESGFGPTLDRNGNAFLTWQRAFRTSAAGLANIPEPSTFLLVALLGARASCPGRRNLSCRCRNG